MDAYDFTGPMYLGASLSWFFAGLVALVFTLPVLGLWARLVKERRAERAARGELDSVGALAAGDRVLVAGEVELARDAARAVRLEIECDGKETRTKNSTSHRWTEVERSWHAEPFYIRQASGKRVRVEPGVDAPLLIDTAGEEGEIRDHRHGPNGLTSAKRTFVSELTAGERVVAVGRLERGEDPEGEAAGAYRGGRTGWVLRPPHSARLRLMSSSILKGNALYQTQLRMALFVAVACLLVAQLPFMTFYLRAVTGEAKVGVVTRCYVHYGRDRHGRRTSSTHVAARCEDGSCAIDEASGRYVDEGRRIWLFSAVSGTTFGSTNSWNGFWLVFHAIAAFVLWLALAAAILRKRWWEKPRFERHLPGPMPRPTDPKEPPEIDSAEDAAALETRGRRHVG